jgi:hypothetical protein
MVADQAENSCTGALTCVLCAAPRPQPFATIEREVYYRCGRCRLTFRAREQLPTRATELETYRLHENDPDDPRYRAFLARLTEPLRRHLTPGMVGLDFGCGPGPTIAPMLGAHGLEVIDYDPFFRPSREALARRYDFITCSEVVEHFHCPGREFERLDALLRAGGWLGVMTGMLEDDARFAGWWYRRDPTHVCFFRRETMSWIAGRFDWRVTFPAPTVALFRKPGPGRPD